jgi:hypothetical protein
MIGSSLIDASEISPRLWIGGHTTDRLSVCVLGIDQLFLCARECQPTLPSWLIPISRGSLDDLPLTAELAAEAHRLGIEVARAMAHRRVLVTCQRGLNRAPLVAAIALQLSSGVSPKNAIDLIRRVRTGSFSNTSFVDWLLERKVAAK